MPLFALYLLIIYLAGAEALAEGRWYKERHASAGKDLYQKHCSACHGKNGEGAKDWHKQGPDGYLPPPPLNGSGHAWHHPLKWLYQLIMQGSPGGQGKMPAWSNVLSQAEVLAIIAWFQSQWSDEVYSAWQRMDEESRKAGL